MHLKTNRCPLLLIIANPYLHEKNVSLQPETFLYG